MLRRFLACAILVVLIALSVSLRARAFAQSPESSTLSLEERAMMASRIYHTVSTFFPGLTQSKFDDAYAEYLRVVLATSDRREFDLASMKFIADLHDGHTWFYDTWLDKNYGQSTGFMAYPLAGKWTVVRSSLDSLKPGDVITAVDTTSVDDYFAQQRKYVSASSDRDAGVSFFDTGIVFPEKFRLTLADGRKIPIDRANDKKQPEPTPKTEGRWLAENSVAYIKLPTFHGIDTQAQAIAFLREFHDAKAVILDVRGNPGHGNPVPLQSALMTGPYQTWTQSASEHGGPLLRNYASGYPEHSTLTLSDIVVTPRDNSYSGRLILLTDRICSCACEDFVMPFKYSKRATLVGETTAGTFSMTRHLDLPNGMMLNIAAVHHTFPDGTQFEGVGIAPHLAVEVMPEDLRANRDPVLQRAMELAQHPEQ
jgi:carboxyl-terminal processing protease